MEKSYCTLNNCRHGTGIRKQEISCSCPVAPILDTGTREIPSSRGGSENRFGSRGMFCFFAQKVFVSWNCPRAGFSHVVCSAHVRSHVECRTGTTQIIYEGFSQTNKLAWNFSTQRPVEPPQNITYGTKSYRGLYSGALRLPVKFPARQIVQGKILHGVCTSKKLSRENQGEREPPCRTQDTTIITTRKTILFESFAKEISHVGRI